jgi:hypothetical protein
MDQKQPIEVDRTKLEDLADHSCAYCGSKHTVLQDVERETSTLVFSIYCNSCSRVDRPMLLTKELMKVLRAFG